MATAQETDHRAATAAALLARDEKHTQLMHEKENEYLMEVAAVVAAKSQQHLEVVNRMEIKYKSIITAMHEEHQTAVATSLAANEAAAIASAATAEAQQAENDLQTRKFLDQVASEKQAHETWKQRAQGCS